jgi:hypothetical protein
MATIEEELALAKQAKVMIEGKPRKETIEVLRKANQMAAAQMSQRRQDKIDKAKSAIECWMRLLK